MVLLSSHLSVPALSPSPQWVTQVPFGNSPVLFGLSYLELDQLQKELEKNGFRPEHVGTEKCDNGNTNNGDGCKGDGASQEPYRNEVSLSECQSELLIEYTRTIRDLTKWWCSVELCREKKEPTKKCSRTDEWI